MSSTINSFPADSNVTDPLRCSSRVSALVSPEISMDCGAPSRLRDNGTVFSSSAMLGNRLECVTGFEVGDVRVAPPNGDRTGDFAGLHGVLAANTEILGCSRHSPITISSPQQLLQVCYTIMQTLPLETPRLPLGRKCIVQQLNCAGLLVNDNLQVQSVTISHRTEATHGRGERDVLQLSLSRTSRRSERRKRVVRRLLEGKWRTLRPLLLCKLGGEVTNRWGGAGERGGGVGGVHIASGRDGHIDKLEQAHAQGFNRAWRCVWKRVATRSRSSERATRFCGRLHPMTLEAKAPFGFRDRRRADGTIVPEDQVASGTRMPPAPASMPADVALSCADGLLPCLMERIFGLEFNTAKVCVQELINRCSRYVLSHGYVETLFLVGTLRLVGSTTRIPRYVWKRLFAWL